MLIYSFKVLISSSKSSETQDCLYYGNLNRSVCLCSVSIEIERDINELLFQYSDLVRKSFKLEKVVVL